jgi:hypothetical protein
VAVSNLLNAVGTTHECDVPMTFRHKVIDGDPSAFDIVHGNRAARRVFARSVDDDKGNAMATQLDDLLADLPDRCQQQSAYTMLFEQPKVRRFLVRLLRAIAQLDRIAQVVDVVLDSTHDVGEERVCDVHDDHADAAASSSTQLPRRFVANPAELGNGLLDSRSRRVGDKGRRIQHIGHRANRHASKRCHVLYADGRPRRRHVASCWARGTDRPSKD